MNSISRAVWRSIVRQHPPCADTNNNRLQKFTSEGRFLRAIGRPGEADGEFSNPDGIAVDLDGSIYVADTGNQRVQKLKPDGSFLLAWKGPPPGFMARGTSL